MSLIPGVRMPLALRALWLAPATFLIVFIAVPLGAVGTTAVTRAGAGPWPAPGTWSVLGLSLVQAALSTALALAVGLPTAAVVSRFRFRGRSFVLALLTVPFVLPTVVVALALEALMGSWMPRGLPLVVLAHAFVNLAVVVRIVGAQWQQLDPRFGAVSRTLGAGPLATFARTWLPMLRAPIAAAAAIVFVFSFTSLGIVLLLGDGTTRTLESQMLRQTSVLLDLPAAAASATLQIAVVGLVLLLATRRRAAPMPLAAPRLLPWPHRRTESATAAAVVAFTSLLVLAPLLALAAASLHSTSGWTLQWWASLGSVDAGTTRIGSPVEALGLSLQYAALCGLIAALVGGAAAVSVLTHRTGRLVAVLALAPIGISAATMGLGLLLAYGRPPADLRATGLLVPLAHALIAIPLVVAVAAPALRTADPRRASVAATLGATSVRALWTAYGPVLRATMIAAGGLAAAVSLGEFGAASFLARAGNPTVPLQIVRLASRPGEQSAGTAAAMAVVLVVLTLVLVLAIDRLAFRGGRK